MLVLMGLCPIPQESFLKNEIVCSYVHVSWETSVLLGLRPKPQAGFKVYFFEKKQTFVVLLWAYFLRSRFGKAPQSSCGLWPRGKHNILLEWSVACGPQASLHTTNR